MVDTFRPTVAAAAALSPSSSEVHDSEAAPFLVQLHCSFHNVCEMLRLGGPQCVDNMQELYHGIMGTQPVTVAISSVSLSHSGDGGSHLPHLSFKNRVAAARLVPGISTMLHPCLLSSLSLSLRSPLPLPEWSSNPRPPAPQMMSLAHALASGPRRTAEWDGWREAAGPVGREGRGGASY